MKPSKGELTKDVMNNQKTWFGETYQLEKKKHSLHMGHIWMVSNVSTLFSFQIFNLKMVKALFPPYL